MVKLQNNKTISKQYKIVIYNCTNKSYIQVPKIYFVSN